MARLTEAKAKQDKAEYHSGALDLDQREKRDQRDMVICANSYISFHRCKICTHLTVDGYICIHCGGDDSV